MSKYTTEVRYICEVSAGLVESTGYIKVEDVIKKALPDVFDFDFPIFDENYRSILETKILKHFYTREIGLETVGLWKLKLDTKLNEIMPYYNKLYESELLKFNPLYDVDVTRTHNLTGNETKNNTNKTNSTLDISKTSNETGNDKTTGSNSTTITEKSTNTGTNNTTNKYSDTPQGGLNGIENDTYLTNATINNNNTQNANDTNTNNDSTSTVENNSTNKITNNEEHTNIITADLDSVLNNTEEFLEHVIGKQGSNTYSYLISEYRKTFLNIDMSIINDLEELFMQLW